MKGTNTKNYNKIVTKVNKTSKNKGKKSTGANKRMHSHNRFNMMLFFTFIVGVVLIVSTYAWFSASLDADVDFVTITVNRETGLYISIDGVEYGDSITISEDDVIDGLRDTYPDHTNKWVSYMGLIPVSSNGIPNNNTSDFAFYELIKERYAKNEKKLYLDFAEFDNEGDVANFVAFDIFLKNISNSPKSDNLYLWEGTDIALQDGTDPLMVALLNSVRVGIAKAGFTPDRYATAATVQDLTCNNDCESVIYEPFSTNHNAWSINKALNYNVDLQDGVFTPTYAVINEGTYLSHYTGHGVQPFDNEHFIFQSTFRNLNTQLFELPHGVTKVRIYIWLEGQDIDSLESKSSGDILDINLVFHKDHAGYE